ARRPGSSSARPRRLDAAARGRRDAVGQRLERELLGRVDLERDPRLVDEADPGAQTVRVCSRGVLAQLGRAVAVVDEVLGAVGDAGRVAQPQPGELEPLVERHRRRAPVRALGLLVALALGALALLDRQQVLLAGDAL